MVEDLIIAHPPCTYLTLAGNKWFKPEFADRFPDRQKQRKEAVDFFMAIAQHLISNGVTVQEWISVEDRLPEHGDVVVVWHTYMEHPFVCQWDERSDCWIDNKWTFGRNTITHWCYLPQPPKGE